MDIRIRVAKPSELLLMDWRMRVLREVFGLSEESDMSDFYTENEKYYNEHMQDGTHTAVLTYSSETVIGCGGICYQTEMPSPDNPNGKCGYLMNIYTLPEYRGMGVGKAIVSFLIEEAKRKNVFKLSLESSDIAKGLYISMGFKQNISFFIKYL